MTKLRRTASAIAIAALLAAPVTSSARDRGGDAGDDGGGYVMATTRGLTQMDIHPALKIPALPFALVVDFLFFPFALLADATS